MLPRRHPASQEARLRHADGRLAEARAGAGAARAAVADVGARARAVRRRPAVRRCCADHEANRSDGTDALLALLNLEIWSRVYLDGRDPDDVADELKGCRTVPHEHPVPVPPLPVPAQARRQDPAVQHDPPPARAAATRSPCVRWCAREAEADEGPGHRAALHRVRDGAGARSRCSSRAWSRGCRCPRRRRWATSISPSSRARCADLLATQRWDLIFVHCSSVAQYVEHVRGIPKILDFGDMDSQKWLEYAQHKPFPLSLGYRLEGRKMLRAEKRLARRFDLCTATTRAEWETLEDYGTGAATDWFPNGVDADFFSPDRRRPTTPTRSASSAAWTTTRTRSAWRASASRSGRCCKAQRPALKLLIVGADPSPAMRALGAAARRHRHRLGARRAARTSAARR